MRGMFIYLNTILLFLQSYFCFLNQYMHICQCERIYSRMEKLDNLLLAETKCKVQILHICKSGHVNGKQNLHIRVSI